MSRAGTNCWARPTSRRPTLFVPPPLQGRPQPARPARAFRQIPSVKQLSRWHPTGRFLVRLTEGHAILPPPLVHGCANRYNPCIGVTRPDDRASRCAASVRRSILPGARAPPTYPAEYRPIDQKTGRGPRRVEARRGPWRSDLASRVRPATSRIATRGATQMVTIKARGSYGFGAAGGPGHAVARGGRRG